MGRTGSQHARHLLDSEKSSWILNEDGKAGSQGGGVCLIPLSGSNPGLLGHCRRPSCAGSPAGFQKIVVACRKGERFVSR